MRANEFEDSKENFVDMFRKFLPLAMKIIGLKSLPKMVFEKSVDSPDQPTFGQYVNDEKILFVGISNRHPNDILRTIAHELVHYRQDLDKLLNHESGETGSPEENEANALAGIVMRNFNKRYPEFLKTKPLVSENTIRIPVNELLINRNTTVHKWQLRNDKNFGLIDEVPSVVLKNVNVAIDHDAYDENRRVFAYLQGDKTNEVPQDLEPFPIGYQRNGHHPFIDKSTGEPIETVDYVSFDEQGKVTGYKQSQNIGVTENFADGRNPQDKGDSARHGIRKGMTIAQLKKIRSSKTASPRKKQLAHWQINMRQGRSK